MRKRRFLWILVHFTECFEYYEASWKEGWLMAESGVGVELPYLMVLFRVCCSLNQHNYVCGFRVQLHAHLLTMHKNKFLKALDLWTVRNLFNFFSFITLSQPELRDSFRSEFRTRVPGSRCGIWLRMLNGCFRELDDLFCNAGGFS